MLWDYFVAFLFGVVEGITEWLPISSTGHMILLDEFIHLNVSKSSTAFIWLSSSSVLFWRLLSYSGGISGLSV